MVAEKSKRSPMRVYAYFFIKILLIDSGSAVLELVNRHRHYTYLLRTQIVGYVNIQAKIDLTWLPSEARSRIFQTSTVPY